MDSRSIYVLVGMLVAVMAQADVAYKWVDEDGVVHFSDVPVAGALNLRGRIVTVSSTEVVYWSVRKNFSGSSRSAFCLS